MILTNQLHILITKILECTQRECKSKEIIVEEYTKDIWIIHFYWSNWTATRVRKASRKNNNVVLTRERTCSKMRLSDVANWPNKKNRAVVIMRRSKMQEKSWKYPWHLLCFVKEKIQMYRGSFFGKRRRESFASQKVPKTRGGCTVESHESTGPRAELPHLTHREDHIASREYTS